MNSRVIKISLLNSVGMVYKIKKSVSSYNQLCPILYNLFHKLSQKEDFLSVCGIENITINFPHL